ncbi:unnamed protein product [Polarella glacialis]|uniref:Poly [ADP-ribose] polymerase n=1 Tax=Polarella glacialis TaxID=89957 RepID=A0A813LZ03_POLGL|nr:unnamed protein product [Polarella glacialis]
MSCIVAVVEPCQAQEESQEKEQKPKVWKWQYGQSGAWCDHCSDHNACLDEAYACGQALLQLTHGRHTYSIDMDRMEQHNTQTGKRRSIRRVTDESGTASVDLSKVAAAIASVVSRRPHYWPSGIHYSPWGTMGQVDLIDVSATMATVMQQRLHDTAHADDSAFPNSQCVLAQKKRVARVLHIQNFDFWMCYAARRAAVVQKCQGARLPEALPAIPAPQGMPLLEAANELLLWHGSGKDSLRSIIQHGFDPRISRAGLYGEGSYFTPWACKALQYVKTSLQADDSCILLLCRVLVGCPYQAQTSYKGRRPPERNDSFGSVHDSVVSVAGPKQGKRSQQFDDEVAIFENTQAYPEYAVFLK